MVIGIGLVLLYAYAAQTGTNQESRVNSLRNQLMATTILSSMIDYSDGNQTIGLLLARDSPKSQTSIEEFFKRYNPALNYVVLRNNTTVAKSKIIPENPVIISQELLDDTGKQIPITLRYEP